MIKDFSALGAGELLGVQRWKPVVDGHVETRVTGMALNLVPPVGGHEEGLSRRHRALHGLLMIEGTGGGVHKAGAFTQLSSVHPIVLQVLVPSRFQLAFPHRLVESQGFPNLQEAYVINGVSK